MSISFYTKGQNFRPAPGLELPQMPMAPTVVDMTALDKILRLSETLGLSQAHLERAAHLSTGRISKWLAGRGRPHLDEGLRIARVLGVSVNDLADPAAPWPPRDQPPLTVDEAVILELVRLVGADDAKACLRDLLTGRRASHGTPPQITMGKTYVVDIPTASAPPALEPPDPRKKQRQGK